MRQAEPQRRQAVLLDRCHLAESCGCGHRAGTSDRSRSRRCRAAATSRCHRRGPRPPRDDRRARQRTSAETKCALRLSGVVRAALLQQPFDPCHRRGEIFTLSGPARREIPGCAVERIDHQPGIVGERRQLCGLRGGDCLDAALARKVSPVSSGSPSPSSPAETASMPYGASSSRISASLPGLWVAITSLPVICGPVHAPI